MRILLLAETHSLIKSRLVHPWPDTTQMHPGNIRIGIAHFAKQNPVTPILGSRRLGQLGTALILAQQKRNALAGAPAQKAEYMRDMKRYFRHNETFQQSTLRCRLTNKTLM